MNVIGRTGIFAITVAAALFSLPGLASAQTAAVPAQNAASERDGQHDFDFLIGSWKAHLRRLVGPLTGSTTWIEYDGTSVTRKVLDSSANLEDFHVAGPPGQRRDGQTLRLYNPASRQWSIYLLDTAKGTLGLPPVVGRFTDGSGEFLDQEEFSGRVILVRYHWFNISPLSARMEQAFSADNGKSWETNWIVEFSRDKGG